MSDVRRIQYGKWFIQSKQGRYGWVAWASLDRMDKFLDSSVGPVYFETAPTEVEAIQKVKAEVDVAQGPTRVWDAFVRIIWDALDPLYWWITRMIFRRKEK
ncbi:MAG TPA: hypothetical protein PKD55_20210 [Bellilinea sp.]|nr:hypothetical protein [Bellilinea sp.]